MTWVLISNPQDNPHNISVSLFERNSDLQHHLDTVITVPWTEEEIKVLCRGYSVIIGGVENRAFEQEPTRYDV